MKQARIIPLVLSLLLLAGLLSACGSQTSAEAPTSSGPGSSPPAAAAAPASPDLNAAVQSGSAASEEGAVSLTLSDAEGSLTIVGTAWVARFPRLVAVFPRYYPCQFANFFC